MTLSYGVFVWMLVDLPVKDAVRTWSVFAAIGALLFMELEVPDTPGTRTRASTHHA